MTADRPDTDPRTEAGKRRLRASIRKVIRGMDRFWNDDAGDADLLAEAVTELRTNYKADILAIEAEAAQGAAPRAEGPKHDEECGSPDEDEPGCPCYCHFRPCAKHGAWLATCDNCNPIVRPAPRAEGLDVERLIWRLIESYPGGVEIDNVQRFREHVRASLSRPPDERGPETPEQRRIRSAPEHSEEGWSR